MPNAIYILLSALFGVAVFSTKALAGESVKTDPFFQWDNLFRRYGARFGVPWRWLKAICIIESSLGKNPRVARGLASPTDAEGSKSSDGKSWGLMQLTLATARGLEGGSITVADLNNPERSVQLAAELLRQLIDTFGIENRESIIRAYNGGPRFGSATIPYYNKFIAALADVMKRQPGPEMEF